MEAHRHEVETIKVSYRKLFRLRVLFQLVRFRLVLERIKILEFNCKVPELILPHYITPAARAFSRSRTT